MGRRTRMKTLRAGHYLIVRRALGSYTSGVPVRGPFPTMLFLGRQAGTNAGPGRWPKVRPLYR